MNNAITIFFMFLASVSFLAGLACILLAFKAKSLPLGSEEEYRGPFGIVAKAKGGGGILGYVFFSAVLILSNSGVAYYKVQSSEARAKISALESQVASLQISRGALAAQQKQLEELKPAILAALQQAEESRPDVRRSVTAALKQEFQPAPWRQDLAQLEAQLTEMRKKQNDIASAQTEAVTKITQTQALVSERTRDFDLIRDKLKLLALQGDVAEVVGQAAGSEFSASGGWQFVEEKTAKGEPKRFKLLTSSPLVESKTASIGTEIVDVDRREVKLTGTVTASDIKASIVGGCKQKGITCLVDSLQVGFIGTRPH